MPSLPSIVSPLPPDVRAFLERVRESIGKSGSALVTQDDILATGLASLDSAGNLITTIVTPPAPTGVSCFGSFATVIISWDDPLYDGHAYAEIWRSDTDNIGEAVVIGQSPGSVFSDSLGEGSSAYYWVRFVSTSNTYGSYDSELGTLCSTSEDPAYLMSALASVYDSAPFITIETETTIDGVTIPAGVYIKSAYILNGAITNAKIKNLAVDTTKISDAAITEAKIADASIGTAKIKTASITNALIALAAISAANIQDATITNAKIADATIENAKIANATIDTAKIKDAAISTAKIKLAAITEALIADAAIGSAKIQDASIGTAKIALSAITTALIQNGAIVNALIGDAAITSAKIGDAEVGTLKIAGNSVSFGGAIVSGGSVGFYTPVGGILTVIAYSGGSYGASLNVYSDAGSERFPPGNPNWIFYDDGFGQQGKYLEAYGPSSGVVCWSMGAGGHYVGFGQDGQAYNAARIIWLFFQR